MAASLPRREIGKDKQIRYRGPDGQFISKPQYEELTNSPADSLAMEMVKFEFPSKLRDFLAERIGEIQEKKPKPPTALGSREPTSGEEKGGNGSTPGPVERIPFEYPDEDLRPYDFTGWKIPGANLQRANLQGVSFREADLIGADLQGAQLQNARLNSSHLENANLNRANLTNADLSAAFLSRATLVSANLSGASLKRARLIETDLSEAKLPSADLSDADLTLAKLDGADVSQDQLSKASSRKYATRRGMLIEELEPADLRQKMTSGLSEEEVRTLCFDLYNMLNTNYTDLQGGSRGDKVRELIALCMRRGCIRELILACQRLNPRVDW